MSSREFEVTAAAKAEYASGRRTESPESAVESGRSPHVAMGASGDPRPQARAAALAQSSGGKLARAGSALMDLQRGYGNRHVQQVVWHARQANSSVPVIQPKLVLGPADDEYEREADRVARQVAGGDVSGRVMRAPAIQRLASAEGGAVDAGVQQAIQQARGGGQDIPERVRAPMEQALGADFSGVRLHRDARADQLNHVLQARAFTTGRDIFFRRGAYAPESRGGKELIAHELTHVVQQSGSDIQFSRAPDKSKPTKSIGILAEAGLAVVQRQEIGMPDDKDLPNWREQDASRKLDTVLQRYWAVINYYRRRLGGKWTNEHDELYNKINEALLSGKFTKKYSAWENLKSLVTKINEVMKTEGHGKHPMTPEDIEEVGKELPDIQQKAKDLLDELLKDEQILTEVFGHNSEQAKKHIEYIKGHIDKGIRTEFDIEGEMAAMGIPAYNQGVGEKSSLKIGKLWMENSPSYKVITMIHEASHGAERLETIDMGYWGTWTSEAILGSSSPAALLNAPTYEIAAARKLVKLAGKEGWDWVEIDKIQYALERKQLEVIEIDPQKEIAEQGSGQRDDKRLIMQALAWADYLLTLAKTAASSVNLRLKNVPTGASTGQGWKNWFSRQGPVWKALGQIAETLESPALTATEKKPFTSGEKEMIRLCQTVIANIHEKLVEIRTVQPTSDGEIKWQDSRLAIPTALLSDPTKAAQGIVLAVADRLIPSEDEISKHLKIVIFQIIENLANTKAQAATQEQAGYISMRDLVLSSKS